VRTAKEWEAAIKGNPFPSHAKNDPSHLLLMPLKTAPAKDDVAALQGAIKGREVVRASARASFILFTRMASDGRP
jgi:uncharacterized protein (DUF1697 family)